MPRIFDNIDLELPDKAYIAHITPGGQTARIADMLKRWEVSISSTS